jgi:hypothetical protein
VTSETFTVARTRACEVLRELAPTTDALRVRVTPAHARKLAAGIVLERVAEGVRVSWGHATPDCPDVFASFAEFTAWLHERRDGMQWIAEQCPGAATAVYHEDKAEFLRACETVVGWFADGMWKA